MCAALRGEPHLGKCMSAILSVAVVNLKRMCAALAREPHVGKRLSTSFVVVGARDIVEKEKEA
eukprot:8223247-Pyramimonas_sp.AAC.1